VLLVLALAESRFVGGDGGGGLLDSICSIYITLSRSMPWIAS